MNHFKQNNNKLEKLRGIFFQIGLIIACGLTLLAFEWTTPSISYDFPVPENIFTEEVWEYPPIIPEKEIEKPKVKKPQAKNTELIEIVTDKYKEIEEKEETTEPIEQPTFKEGEWKEVENFKEEEAPKVFVSKMPHYLSCEFLNAEDERKKCTQEKMYEHFSKTIHIPETIKIRGKAVYKAFVYFEVNKKGEIANVKILNDEKHKIPKELERQAYNAVKSLPTMIPGNNQGKKVSILYKVPITFTVM